MRRFGGLGVALGAAATTMVAQFTPAAESIRVDPQAVQGQTEAAIAEFRAAAALEPDLANGGRLFAGCAGCHGANGAGSEAGDVPVIAGQHVSVLVKQLVDFRHDRRWSERMQDAATRHELAGPQELLDVAAYAESLTRPPPRAGGTGYGDALHQGQIVYYRDCEACHGRLGEGDLRQMRPRLAGQHFKYLLKQLNDTADGDRPGMDDLHMKRIGALSPDERAAVADYLSRLSPGFSSSVSK
jgi:cytochrome c553